MNSYGTKFRLSIFGESHGPLIGVVLDGVPAGMPLSREDFLADLDRRRSGAKGSTPRKESDLPEIVSGVCDGHTTGAPLTIVFRNSNTRSGDYSDFRATPRPGHADFVAERKYRAFNDLRGGGHFSGRLTLTLVAGGVGAKKMIGPVEIRAPVTQVGGEFRLQSVASSVSLARLAKHGVPVRVAGAAPLAPPTALNTNSGSISVPRCWRKYASARARSGPSRASKPSACVTR